MTGHKHHGSILTWARRQVGSISTRYAAGLPRGGKGPKLWPRRWPRPGKTASRDIACRSSIFHQRLRRWPRGWRRMRKAQAQRQAVCIEGKQNPSAANLSRPIHASQCYSTMHATALVSAAIADGIRARNARAATKVWMLAVA